MAKISHTQTHTNTTHTHNHNKHTHTHKHNTHTNTHTQTHTHKHTHKHTHTNTHTQTHTQTNTHTLFFKLFHCHSDEQLVHVLSSADVARRFNAHSETGRMAVCFQNLTLGALSSRNALSVLVGALFKKFDIFLSTPRISMKNSNDTIGNRTRDLPTCSTSTNSTNACPQLKVMIKYWPNSGGS
jgi:hypothetical protein